MFLLPMGAQDIKLDKEHFPPRDIQKLVESQNTSQRVKKKAGTHSRHKPHPQDSSLHAGGNSHSPVAS